MNIHEYQAKRLLKEQGLPVPLGIVATTLAQAYEAVEVLGGSKWVIKAQVHAGARGKGGGIKIATTHEEVETFVNKILNSYLVTPQTDKKGKLVTAVLIEEPTLIAKELYLSLVLDRDTQRVRIMASTEGGVDIETVAHETPDKIVSELIDPLLGVQGFQIRAIAESLQLNSDQTKELRHILINLYQFFIKYDSSLLEINPLVITKDGHLVCVDAKVNIDDNAIYRQPILEAMYDRTQEDEREIQARIWEINYIALEGNIGCMVNGAGLAMATMDIIKLYGGDPANFLDVGGSATQERVTQAFKIILSDKKVKAILVNIFGGIVRCNLIAEGIVKASQEVGITIPVIVRLEGNNAELGADILNKSGLNITSAANLNDAAQKAVASLKGTCV
jgi:succinyl-CoA synthetase beta subunit